jgi:flagella basal body P-ring formation protein FlgA
MSQLGQWGNEAMTSRGRFIGAAVVALTCAVSLRAQTRVPELPAMDVIRAAVVDRLGPDVEITITPVSVPAEPKVFRTATPDPTAFLGKPMRFSLVTGTGRTVSVIVDVKAVAEYAMATHSISRGQVLKPEDIAAAKSELKNIPLRRLPTADALVGAKTLRPLEVGTPVQASFVQLKRVVEPGDKVTAVAGDGGIEVSATLVAADGGDIGDVIRVVNPQTHRYVRGKIVRAGIVEVMHDR